MSGWGSPALRLLLRLKLRGAWRRQLRRLRTPKGALLSLLGAALFVLWMAGPAFQAVRASRTLAPETAELRVRAAGLLLGLITLAGALAHRGLFLHKSEIERLFSAPLSRSDLVRYRLASSAIRGAFGGLILGLYSMRNMPSPALALAGVLLAMQSLPVVNQMAAIALGGLERKTARFLRRASGVLFALLVGAFALLVIGLNTHIGDLSSMPLLGPLLASFVNGEQDPLAHPLLARLTLPFVPWARMISAPSAAQFAPWFAVCLALHAGLVEACARLPVDFRELSLDTSDRVAARIARVRRGGGAAATRPSAASARWPIPWLFGRTPLGAIAWRKCAGLVRKAQSALWVALLALGFITLMAHVLFGGDPEQAALGTPIAIAVGGTFYLCSGLRFDFREDLERMDVIRAWPQPSWRVFLATLLPEVVLVALLLDATVFVNALLAGALGWHVFVILGALPLVVFAWVALDNGVFLFAPVRMVPGQEGMLLNVGRRLVQLSLLFLLVAGAAVACFFVVGPVWLAVHYLGGSPELVVRAVIPAVFVGLMGVDVLLVWLGGKVLRRFDVARDRG